MSALCDACEAPLDSPFFSRCAACEIESIASDARRRFEGPISWETLPERWRRVADGWGGFSEEFQAELRQFLVEMYQHRADEVLGKPRYDGRLAPRFLPEPSLPLDVFDDPEAEEWAKAGG